MSKVCGPLISPAHASGKYSLLLLFHISEVHKSVHLLSHIQLFGTPWTAARQVSLSITNSQSFLKLMSINSVMPSNRLTLCHPLLLLSSIFPIIRVFSNKSVLCIRWPKYWSFNFSISPTNEYSGLISFRIDWFDLIAVQGFSRVFHSITVQKHQFFSAQSSLWSNSYNPYKTTVDVRIIALTRWTFVG